MVPLVTLSTEFDFRSQGDGRSASARYANHSNYRNDSLIRKESGSSNILQSSVLTKSSVRQLASYCRDQAHYQGEWDNEVRCIITRFTLLILIFAGKTTPSGQKRIETGNKNSRSSLGMNTYRLRSESRFAGLKWCLRILDSQNWVAGWCDRISRSRGPTSVLLPGARPEGPCLLINFASLQGQRCALEGSKFANLELFAVDQTDLGAVSRQRMALVVTWRMDRHVQKVVTGVELE